MFSAGQLLDNADCRPDCRITSFTCNLSSFSLPQYRDKFMVSPSPIVRPIVGDWQLDGLLDELPQRPPDATEKLRKILDFYLHSMVFHKDRLGRPVRLKTDRALLLV